LDNNAKVLDGNAIVKAKALDSIAKAEALDSIAKGWATFLIVLM
jgi:hypothetical protein